MESLLDIYSLACPHCGNDEVLHIAITCMSRVTNDGSEPFGDHDWHAASFCLCPACKHDATVAEFASRREPAVAAGALYNHAYDIAFSIETSDPSGGTTTGPQFREAVQRRLAALSDDELIEAVGLPFDSYKMPKPAG